MNVSGIIAAAVTSSPSTIHRSDPHSQRQPWGIHCGEAISRLCLDMKDALFYVIVRCSASVTRYSVSGVTTGYSREMVIIKDTRRAPMNSTNQSTFGLANKPSF